MQLVVGLGNPGPRYVGTRHNVGFRVCEAVARRLGAAFAIRQPEYRAAEARGPGGPVTLIEPLTFMNRSGRALAAWWRDSGEPIVPIVVCDDLHLPLGSLRIRERGSAGGQNGLASILAEVGTEDVPRLRLGVGPPDDAVLPADWADFVLEPFAPDEQTAAAELVDRAAEAVLYLLEAGVPAAGSRFNRRRGVAPDLPPDDR